MGLKRPFYRKPTMQVPNKVTLIAAAIHAVCEDNKTLWVNLTDAERLSFSKVAEFLCQYASGAALPTLDQAKLAAQVEKMFPDLKVNANHVVTLFLNISVALH